MPLATMVGLGPGNTVLDVQTRLYPQGAHPRTPLKFRPMSVVVSLVMTGACLSSKEERVVLYAIKREPSDLGG